MSKSIFSNLRKDLPAGLVVFLIAVPLCLGIALASGAPLFSGLISGIIGGIVIGLVSNSSLSVSGPAAGLTAVVLAAITSLGSFDAFLLSVVIAGVLQLTLGFLKAGVIANYFPSNVIKGMLTGIGIIIILKQLPHAFGYDKDTEGDFFFLQPDGHNTLSTLLQPFYHIDLGAMIIALVAMSIIILWEKPFMKKIAFLPGPLVAVVAGTLLNEWWRAGMPGLVLRPEHLVTIPAAKTAGEFAALFHFPDFGFISNPKVWITGFTIAIVASLETLLCIEAVDKLDPERRVTSPNRELKAQGLGNLFAGLLGGLPVTSVIVRSSANLNAGAKSKVATITHGLLILACVALLPGLLNRIPLAVLAAILLVTGYKLAKVSIFRDMFSRGWHQWLPFIITVLAVVFTDLLTGVAIGMSVAAILILRINMKGSYFFHREEFENGDHIVITLAQEVSFLSRASIKVMLDHLPENSTVNINAASTVHVDEDVLEIIREFKTITAPQKNIHVTTTGLKEKYEPASGSFTMLRRNALVRNMIRGQKFIAGQTKQLYNNVTGNDGKIMRILNREAQDLITPDDALRLLKEGNERFVNNLKFHRNLLQQVNETKEGQFPFATILSCIDSRTSAELIFDQGLGDIFSVRVAGNVVNEDILGSMEFACNVAGSKVIIVLGHTKCGAVKGAVAKVEMGHLTGLLDKLRPAISSFSETQNATDEFVDRVAAKNVLISADAIRQRSSILRDLEKSGTIRIVGAMYDVETGVVNFYDANEVPTMTRKVTSMAS